MEQLREVEVEDVNVNASPTVIKYEIKKQEDIYEDDEYVEYSKDPTINGRSY